tara:strand:- start:80 stop:1465 length:1386 start_codon:yes stop_codon:yes gene_type:complete
MKHIGQNVFELPTSFRNDIFGLCDHFRLTCDDVRFYSENLKDPLFQVRNERNDANGPRMRLTKVRTSGFQPLLSGITTDATALAGQDNDVCGTFEFMSSDSAANTQIYAQLQGTIHDATSTQESGKLSLGVASHDGDIANGLVLTGGSIDDEVDVTIGNGSASLTTIAGDLAVTTGLNAGSSLTFDSVSLSRIITSSESFADNDVSLMTSAALEDRYSPIAGSSSIVTTGTVSSGTWQGTAIASAYLDSDTSHLSVAQTFTAAKTFGTTNKLQFRDANAYINSPDSNDIEIAATDITLDAAGTIKLEGPVRPTGQIQAVYTSFQADDIDTKHYLAFNDGDSENTSASHVDMPIIAPTAGKLLSVSIRQSRNTSSHVYTLRLETQATGVTFATGPTIVGTQSGNSPSNTSIVTYDFTSSLDSGDNVIDAGDVVHISIESNSSPGGSTKYFFTCLFEWDYSSI